MRAQSDVHGHDDAQVRVHRFELFAGEAQG